MHWQTSLRLIHLLFVVMRLTCDSALLLYRWWIYSSEREKHIYSNQLLILIHRAGRPAERMDTNVFMITYSPYGSFDETCDLFYSEFFNWLFGGELLVQQLNFVPPWCFHTKVKRNTLSDIIQILNIACH